MRIRRLLNSIRALLAMPDHLKGELREVERALRTVEKATQHNAKRHGNEMETLHGEMASLRDEVRERLLQYH